MRVQGFASGDLNRDAHALRLFLAAGAPMLLAQSFAKNMGLYGERAGALHVVCADADEARRVLSQLKGVVRPMYSSPPRHGAAVARELLRDPVLFAEWQRELAGMADRIKAMRAVRCGQRTAITLASALLSPQRRTNVLAPRLVRCLHRGERSACARRPLQSGHCMGS